MGSTRPRVSQRAPPPVGLRSRDSLKVWPAGRPRYVPRGRVRSPFQSHRGLTEARLTVRCGTSLAQAQSRMSNFGQTLSGASAFNRWTLTPFVLRFTILMALLADEWTLKV